ncbi:hypothetical protein QBC46DRAFT_324280 [Diplogelasinospora grovesii]|uniref:DUF6546 domain-containing protein n=1 Tax=Diplogelasinospora grovesii TaxID=303347 RepID=A0AAN6MXK3_9PEZI|nr:hypothetical protein QBC46DRAFT_324280 [Diplogelasinospora grovesii]
MGCWARLPAEIRLMVLENVAEDYRYKSEPHARAGYAIVCQEWRAFFEPRNFQRLVLDQDRISDFELFLGRESPRSHRQEYVRHVVLRIRLGEYTCAVCKSKEDGRTVRRNNMAFSNAVWNLLIILSRWNPGHKGLTLELGAYSPSDSKHTFKDFRLEPNYPYQVPKDLDKRFESYKLRIREVGQLGLDSTSNDPYHGWVGGLQEASSVGLGAKQRIMGTLSLATNRRGFSALPRVEFVTGLLIRRQLYRAFSGKALARLLSESFPCLRRFRHEGWRNVDPSIQLRSEKDYECLILQSLPNTLRTLHVFEDSNKLLHSQHPPKAPNMSLGRALSRSSRFLETLSVAFLVDAEDFLTEFWPTKPLPTNVLPWENLRRLALTSRLLHPSRMARGDLGNLLVAAGRAASFMPKLVSMEIWNGGEGNACIFRYRNAAGERPRIILSTNWGSHVELDYDVIQCWANMPRHGQHLIAEVIPLPLRRNVMRTYAHIIHHLKLRYDVLDPISHYQVYWENEQLRLEEKAARARHRHELILS